MTLPIYEPMLANRWPSVFADTEWGYEVKWDGVRTLLYFDGVDTKLRSRSGLDVTVTYPELQRFTASQPLILDGEIIALDDAGRPSFGRLQSRMNVTSPAVVAETMTTTPITYMVFDVLYHGTSIINRTWDERRSELTGLELPHPVVVSEAIAADPSDLWDFVVERHIEGIVAKRRESRYRPGARTADWRKITTSQTVRAVVGGFTRGDGGRGNSFGALLLGLWADDGLRWIGSVGTGFSDSDLSAIRHALDQMTLERSPFIPNPDMPKNVTWVFPQLVASVEYKEWTSVGRLRAPAFKGFTDDTPGSVDWESEGP